MSGGALADAMSLRSHALLRARGVALACALSMAGCSSMPSVSGFAEKVSTGFGLWETVDPSAKPAPLVTFAPTASASIAWQANAGEAGNFVFSPGIDPGGLYAAGAAGAMAKFSPASGAQSWRVDAEQPLSAGVGTGGDLHLIATPKGDVLAYDAEGKLRWKVSLRSEILAPPRVADGIVVVRTADARLFGLDAVDGKRKWIYARPNPALTVRSAASVVIYRGAVFAGFAGGRLIALKLPTGLVGWETAVALPKGTTELERVTDVTSDPVLDDKQVCAVAFQGRLACFDILRGTLIWARDVSSYAGLSMDNRHVYVTDDKGAVYAFDKEQGASIWKQDKLFARRVTAPQVVGSYVAVGDFEGYVHFLKRDDGSFAARLATDGSAIAASPKPLDDKLVVQTRKGGLFAISIQ